MGQGAGLVALAEPCWIIGPGETRSFRQVRFASRSQPPAVWCDGDGDRVQWEPTAQIGGGSASDEMLRQIERRRRRRRQSASSGHAEAAGEVSSCKRGIFSARPCALLALQSLRGASPAVIGARGPANRFEAC